MKIRQTPKHMGVNHVGRNECLDAIKGIGIFFVLLGHLLEWGSLPSNVIYGFHMPLFFIVSGVLFGGMKRRSLRECIARVWERLLIPYLFFLIVGIVFWFLRTDFSIITNRAWIRIFWSWTIGCHPVGNANLWFLVVLAEALLGLRLVITWIDGGWGRVLLMFSALIGLSLLTLTLPTKVRTYSPFCLCEVPAAIFYMLFGWIIREKISWNLSMCAISVGLCCILVEFYVVLHIPPVGFGLRIAHPLLLLASLCGVYFILVCGKACQRFHILCDGLSVIGKNSLFFFALDAVIRPYLGLICCHWGFPLRVMEGRVLATGQNSVTWTLCFGALMVLSLWIFYPMVQFCEGRFARMLDR